MKSSTESNRQLLTIFEAATLLSVAPVTLRKWSQQGRVPVVRLGRAVRMRLADVEKITRMGLERGANEARKEQER